MKCINCNHKRTEVINSRKSKGGINVWRRRKCLKCESIFTTTEHAYNNNLFVIKRSKKKTRLSYEKMFVSVFTSFQNTKYFDNGETAKKCKKIVDRITAKILALRKKEVNSKEIIPIVFHEIYKIDKFAAEKYKNYSHFRLETLKNN